jgi:transcriptional regulator with XRE-family HTH domain
MFLLKSDDQRQKTIKRIEGLKIQIERVRQKHGAERGRNFATITQRHIRELGEQVNAYDRLKQEGPGAFRPQDVSEIGTYLIRARVASGMTQAELAKRLDVSQPMVHKHEIAEYQGASIHTLAEVAKALNVSLDIEAFSAQRNVDYQPARQEAVILYFLQQVNNRFLGRTKLMKLLYYTDYEWLEKTGASITGDAYVAKPFGPMPKHALETLQRLEKRGAIRVEKTKVVDYDQERYLPLEDPDAYNLTREEHKNLEKISRRFEHWTAKQMTDLSHEDWPWKSTRLGEEISFLRLRGEKHIQRK